jgi:hypothetical protein
MAARRRRAILKRVKRDGTDEDRDQATLEQWEDTDAIERVVRRAMAASQRHAMTPEGRRARAILNALLRPAESAWGSLDSTSISGESAFAAPSINAPGGRC